MKKFVSFALAIALVCTLAAAMAGAAFAADKADITINGFNCPENEGVTAVLTGETVGAELYWWYVLTFEPDSASGGYKCVDKKTIGEGEETGTISKKDMVIPAGGFAIGSNTGNDYPSIGQTDKPNYVTAANNAAFNAVQATEVGDIVYLVGVDLEKGTIEIAPLAYMRGRTLDDAFIILDEAQNTTPEQMKMFLTRLGNNSKVIVTGDVTQIDLPFIKKSGLIEAVDILDGIDGIAIFHFTHKDVVRHPLVQRIILAYEKNQKQRAQTPARTFKRK